MALLGTPPGSISLPIKDILAFFAFLIFGVSGIVMIFRQEVDFWILQFYGPLAIIIGVLLTILGFFLASIPVVANIP